MKNLIIALILVSIGYGCKNVKSANDSGIVTFDLKELPEISNVKLTDLGFTDIEYFPLETSEQSVISFTDNVFLGPTPPIKIVVGEGFYLIHQFNTILKFREDGSFVTKIGTAGRGPKEFTVAHDININIEDRNIYLVSGWQKKFNVYSENGEFVRTFQMPLYALIEFSIVDNNILCYCENHMGNIENSYMLLDTNGLVIKSFPNNFPFKNHDAFVLRSENLFYKFNNQSFKKEAYSDTIYVYEKMDFKPHLVIEVGKKLITKDVRSMYNGMDIAKNYIQQLNLFEFGDYIYYDFIYRFALPDVLLTYSFIGSKKNNFQALFNRSEGIINDLDGGPNILPRTVKDDNTIIALVDAVQLKTHVASETFKNSSPKYPEKKIKLEKLANSLKETDNPVLVLVRLKK
jgi:hypothetical protein